MSSTFSFPSEFSTAPAGGAYYKFEQGENRFRIMSEPVFGQEYWKTVDGKRKPIRVKLTEVVPASELEVDKWGNPGRANHFMGMVVYDYKEGMFKILTITQKTVNAGIKALLEDSDWGDPREYDIKVTKTGTERDTDYKTVPGAKKKMPANILDEYKKKTFNLEALFDGTDPFSSVEGESGTKDKMPF